MKKQLFLILPFLIQSIAFADLFPKGGSVFTPLVANPEEAKTQVYYTQLDHRDVVDFSVGHSFGLYRWDTAAGSFFQLDFSGVVMPRFILSSPANKLETSDYDVNLPLSFRLIDEDVGDSLLGRLTLLHKSAHSGDDKINATPYSQEVFQILLAKELVSDGLLNDTGRLYIGSDIVLHSVGPSEHKIRVGTDCESYYNSRYGAFFGFDFLFAATELRSPNSNIKLGFIILSRSAGSTHELRPFVGYYYGDSPHGQLLSNKESMPNVGMEFKF